MEINPFSKCYEFTVYHSIFNKALANLNDHCLKYCKKTPRDYQVFKKAHKCSMYGNLIVDVGPDDYNTCSKISYLYIYDNDYILSIKADFILSSFLTFF